MGLFGKKKSSRQAVESNPNWGAPGVPESAVAQPRRKGNHWANEWQHPNPDPGLPGICGYLNGVQGHGEQSKRHPDRFVYIRPDGQPDDERAQADPNEPLRPSTRPVPRGFFGPSM